MKKEVSLLKASVKKEDCLIRIIFFFLAFWNCKFLKSNDILFPCNINHPISQTHIGDTKGGTYNEHSIQNSKSHRDSVRLSRGN